MSLTLNRAESNEHDQQYAHQTHGFVVPLSKAQFNRMQMHPEVPPRSNCRSHASLRTCFSPLGSAGEALSRPQRFPFKLFRRLSVSPNLHRTTVEEGTALNGKRLVVNVTHHMSLRLQKDGSTLYRTLDRSVHHHALGRDGSVDMSPTGDHEGRAV
jgi:hypothetical protein